MSADGSWLLSGESRWSALRTTPHGKATRTISSTRERADSHAVRPDNRYLMRIPPKTSVGLPGVRSSWESRILPLPARGATRAREGLTLPVGALVVKGVKMLHIRRARVGQSGQQFRRGFVLKL